MKQQICNSCTRTLGRLEKAHLFEGKVVCGKCIKILRPKPKVKYLQIAKNVLAKAKDSREINAKLARDARARTDEFVKGHEDARYEKAKRRCVFFMSSVIWLIQLILFFVFLVMIPMIFVLVSAIGWFFR